MSRIKGLTAGIFGLGLLLAACNSTDGGGGAPITETDLLGAWSISTMHEKGTEKTTLNGVTTTKNVDTTTTMPAGSGSIEFKADKSLAINMGFPISGTWKLSGTNTVTTIVSFFGTADTTDMTVTINGTQGTFVSREVTTDEEAGVTMEEDIVTTITATKQ